MRPGRRRAARRRRASSARRRPPDTRTPPHMTEPRPGPTAGPRRVRGVKRSARLAERARGPWRVVVSESSMVPTIEPGDWLLVDPTTRRWPRVGSIVVFHEPDSELLAIKRVAAGPGE